MRFRVSPWACRPMIAYKRGGAGSIGAKGSTGAVRRIKTGKRREVLKYKVFAKDGNPVNLLNLQNLFNL